MIIYMHFYLLNHKHPVCINSKLSELNKFISGLSQDSIVELIISNCSFKDVYYFLKNANAYNFAGHNTLGNLTRNFAILISALESESNISNDWLKTNKIIVNPIIVKNFNRF